MAGLGDRYRLVERLGAGGMSVVWRAFDEVLGRQVAVKVLAGDFAGSREFRAGIRREARAAARLAHPNVGIVYDYGESRDPSGLVTSYVVMELVDGPALNERLHAGPLPWREAVAVCAQIAAGLGAAHARGLVHRDVKPANVMLSTAGAKVVDFGISALVGERADRAADGRVLGTPAYVAPERLTGAPVGTAADVYALGIVLFKALTGRSPWPTDDPVQMLAAHLFGRPEPLPPLPGLPAEVGELYLRCLAKEPEERPDAGEVASVLATAAGLTLAPAAPGRGPVPASPSHPEGELTTLLPAPSETAPIGVGGSAPVPARRHGTRPLGPHPRRRAVAGLALLPLLAVLGGLYLSTTADRHPDNQAAAAGPACAVTYRLGTDDGSNFTGTLTVDGIRAEPAGGWAVSFDLPARQTFRVAAPATATQTGHHVVVRLTGAVGGSAAGAGGPVSVPFSGSYQGANPLPAAFVAGGQSCTPILIGPSGQPVVPAVVAPSTPDGAGAGAAGPQPTTGGGGDGSGGDQGDEGGGKPGKGKGKG